MEPAWAASSAGRVHFGLGTAELAGPLARIHGRRVFVCTDPVLTEHGVPTPVLASLRAAGLIVDSHLGGEPEVSRLAVEAAAAAAAKFAPDVILGIGGGSNLDMAKGVALLLAHGGRLPDYYGESRVPGPVTPIIAVPTTAGTGSEVTPVAVFSDNERALKAGVSSPFLLPVAAVVDPLLTLTCPKTVTAHSGLDALSHAIEATCAASYRTFPPDVTLGRVFTGKNPYSDSLAAAAIDLVAAHLFPAYDDGSNLVAREGMMLASLLAGLAFSAAGTGVVHALQYPLGARTHTAHGHGNALLMPAVLRFNVAERPQELAHVARTLGAASIEVGDDAAARLAPAAVAQLAARVGVAPGLRHIGLAWEDLPAIAQAATGIERLVRANPRLVTEADLLAILRDAFNGEEVNA